MHTELWFPSVVWSAILNNIDNNSLKDFAYHRKKNDVGRTISNYGGYQSSDIISGDHPEVDNLIQTLNTEANWCAKQVGIGEVEIYNVWININPPGAYNHLHNHIGSVFSGVYYVDAGDMQGNIQFERSDGGEYHIPEFVEKEISFEQSLRINNWDRPSDTITATGPEIHPNKERRVSVRECARIQTFPDDFEFEGSLNTMYKQIGNAVPVLLGKKIGEEIFYSLKNYEKQKSNTDRDRKIREKIS